MTDGVSLSKRTHVVLPDHHSPIVGRIDRTRFRSFAITTAWKLTINEISVPLMMVRIPVILKNAPLSRTIAGLNDNHSPTGRHQEGTVSHVK